MLQINYIRENKEYVLKRLEVKHFEAKETVESIIEIDTKRRDVQKQLDDCLAESNILSREIGRAKSQEPRAKSEVPSVKSEEVIAKSEERRAKSENLKVKSKALAEELSKIEENLKSLLILLPNLPHASIPKGNTAEDNLIVYEEGEKPVLSKNAVPHWDLVIKFGLIDFERGNKITGAGFPVYRGKGAKLQRALLNFFLDNAINNGYTEIEPPVLVNEASAFGTGQLPDKDNQMYYVGIDNFYLVPTAEVPVTNLYRDEILKFDDLPVKNVAYTPCFRREAGSYGKDVRGLNRLHQFDKVEIVQIQHPDKSYETLEEMKDYVAGLLKKLELPFRIVKLCGADMSFTSAFTYDMEVYSGAQQKWLEVSSISNFESFQTNRMKLRFRDTDGKIKLAHTLNGSALALPRIVAALLENNQLVDGIKIPAALQEYTGFQTILNSKF